MVLAGMPAGAPESIDARAARLAFRPNAPFVCCATGAAIDVRHKHALLARLPELSFSEEGPQIDGIAPSGVIQRLASLPHCAALGELAGGVRGDGCRIRALDERFLLDGCALFPLEVIGTVLVPSERIPDEMLADAAPGEPSLWDEARPRFVARFGEPAAAIVDAAADQLRARKSRGLHLKTLR